MWAFILFRCIRGKGELCICALNKENYSGIHCVAHRTRGSS